MNKFLSYPWAIPFGLYFYVLFQALFLVRFGSINTSVNVLDASIVLVGIVSVLILMFFSKKLERGRGLLLIAFLIAVPLGYIGALSGGLLGTIGILIFGIVPFAVIIPIGYWLISRTNKKPEMPAAQEPVSIPDTEI